MSVTGAEISAKLESAGNAESTTAVESATAAAVSQAKVDGSQAQGTKDDGSAKKAPTEIPYSRFKEKVDQVADLQAKLDRALKETERFTAREDELRARVSTLEEEASTLERVRALANDDRYRPMIEKLDRVLRGIQEDVESGDKTQKQADVETSKTIEKYKSEIENAHAEMKADLLLQQARSVAERMLEALPAEYDDGDRQIISRLWTPEVDWDGIEEKPDTMRAKLAAGLETALKRYGEPRGALKSKLQNIETNPPQRVEPTKSPDQVVQEISSQEWGALNRDEKGRATPKFSEAEFTGALSKILREANRG